MQQLSSAVPASQPDLSTALLIHEIFYSIQGESTFAGVPCVFVRLTGCDLRCTWCDTPYAFHEGTRVPLNEVLTAVGRYGCSLVEVTGGEPLLQRAVYPLMASLLEMGKTVLLETGGHRSIADVPQPVIKIIDIKCPGSTQETKNCWSNLDRLAAHDQVKFVVANRDDYEYAKQVIDKYQLATRCAAVLLSPVHDAVDLSHLASWILADVLPVRLQVQLHKYIWGADVRGV